MASKEARKRKLEEYEMQLFGFHSRAVYATLRDIVQDRIKSNIEKLCKTLEKTYKFEGDRLQELKENRQQLTKAYIKGALPHLKHIENVTNKSIAVPNNVLLEEDQSQKVQYTSVQFANMKQNLEDMQERAKRAVMLNAALKAELEIQRQFEQHEEGIKRMCNIVNQVDACPTTGSELSDFCMDYGKFIKELDSLDQPTQPKCLKVSDIKVYNDFDTLVPKDIDVNSL